MAAKPAAAKWKGAPASDRRLPPEAGCPLRSGAKRRRFLLAGSTGFFLLALCSGGIVEVLGGGRRRSGGCNAAKFAPTRGGLCTKKMVFGELLLRLDYWYEYP